MASKVPKPTPTGNVQPLPSTDAWEVMKHLLSLFMLPGQFPDLERLFQPEAIEQARDLAHKLWTAIQLGHDQELGRALFDVFTKDKTARRAGVVFMIRVSATRDKDGDPDSVPSVVGSLSSYDHRFEALRDKGDFVASFLGRVYGKGGKRISPEYCAAVFSIETGAFDDKPSSLNSPPDDYRELAKVYVKAVDEYNKKKAPPPPPRPPAPDVYEAANHSEMLRRAVAAGWLTRGAALLEDIAEDGERVIVPAPAYAKLTLSELRTALREAEERHRRRPPPVAPYVGAREKKKR